MTFALPTTAGRLSLFWLPQLWSETMLCDEPNWNMTNTREHGESKHWCLLIITAAWEVVVSLAASVASSSVLANIARMARFWRWPWSFLSRRAVCGFFGCRGCEMSGFGTLKTHVNTANAKYWFSKWLLLLHWILLYDQHDLPFAAVLIVVAVGT